MKLILLYDSWYGKTHVNPNCAGLDQTAMKTMANVPVERNFSLKVK